jgi:hypothetical protein
MGSCTKTKKPTTKEEVIQFASGLWQHAETKLFYLEKEIKAALNAIYKFELYLFIKSSF